MDLEKKLALLSILDSYWDMLPSEIQHLILKFRESQTLIDWRERCVSRRMCWEIQGHAHLRRQWFIGPIRCEPGSPKKCDCRSPCFFMKIFGYYWTWSGEKKRVFLGYSFWNAIPECDSLKFGLDYEINRSHAISVFRLDL